MTFSRRTARRPGFTLIELLVVILIIILVSVAVLPIALPALYHRQVNEGARMLQASLVGARDAAIRADAPRGIRLVLDYQYNGPTTFAASQIIPIEPAPDYKEGRVNLHTPTTDPLNGAFDPMDPRIGFQESKFDSSGLINSPTSWFWNIRQGDRIRFGDAGRYYTIAGPMLVGVRNPGTGQIVNADRYINFGAPTAYQSLPNNTNVEFLFVVNGQDDDGDGWVDESFDGIDNDGDGVTDPGFDGIDNDGDGVVDNYAELFWSWGPNGYNPAVPGSGEYEKEVYVGPHFGAAFRNEKYTILRRPVPTPGARAVALPSDVVVDLTTTVPVMVGGVTYPATHERSRVPVDPYTGYVDILIAPNGQVVQAGAASNAAPPMSTPFYHFWLSERADVHEPQLVSGRSYLLPMPASAPNYASQGELDLKGERRLITLFTRTGLVTSNAIDNFNGLDTNVPFYDAQSGRREEPK